MRTTIDIPDPLYRQVKIKAFERGMSLRALMISGLRREIEERSDPVTAKACAREDEAVYTTNDLGFVVLRRSGRKQVVRDEFINEMRDREGV